MYRYKTIRDNTYRSDTQIITAEMQKDGRYYLCSEEKYGKTIVLSTDTHSFKSEFDISVGDKIGSDDIVSRVEIDYDGSRILHLRRHHKYVLNKIEKYDKTLDIAGTYLDFKRKFIENEYDSFIQRLKKKIKRIIHFTH